MGLAQSCLQCPVSTHLGSLCNAIESGDAAAVLGNVYAYPELIHLRVFANGGTIWHAVARHGHVTVLHKLCAAAAASLEHRATAPATCLRTGCRRCALAAAVLYVHTPCTRAAASPEAHARPASTRASASGLPPPPSGGHPPGRSPAPATTQLQRRSSLQVPWPAPASVQAGWPPACPSLAALVNRCNERHQTPLHVACCHGHHEVANALLQMGAAPLTIDRSTHRSALMYAAIFGNVACARVLLQHAAERDAAAGLAPAVGGSGTATGSTSSSGAGGLSPVGMSFRLLETRSASGCSPLHYAVYYGRSSLVELLLQHGADASAAMTRRPWQWWRRGGTTPLHLAARSGDLDTALAILRHSARHQAQGAVDLRDLRDHRGWKPFHVAYAQRSYRLSVILRPDYPPGWLFGPSALATGAGADTAVVPSLARLAATALEKSLLQQVGQLEGSAAVAAAAAASAAAPGGPRAPPARGRSKGAAAATPCAGDHGLPSAVAAAAAAAEKQAIALHKCDDAGVVPEHLHGNRQQSKHGCRRRCMAVLLPAAVLAGGGSPKLSPQESLLLPEVEAAAAAAAAAAPEGLYSSSPMNGSVLAAAAAATAAAAESTGELLHSGRNAAPVPRRSDPSGFRTPLPPVLEAPAPQPWWRRPKQMCDGAGGSSAAYDVSRGNATIPASPHPAGLLCAGDCESTASQPRSSGSNAGMQPRGSRLGRGAFSPAACSCAAPAGACSAAAVAVSGDGSHGMDADVDAFLILEDGSQFEGEEADLFGIGAEADYAEGEAHDDDESCMEAALEPCGVCLEELGGHEMTVIAGCGHSLCTACARRLCNGSGARTRAPTCPFCRAPIAGFVAVATAAPAM